MGADVVNEPASGERTVLPPSDMAAMLRLATFLERHTEPAGLVGPDGQMVLMAGPADSVAVVGADFTSASGVPNVPCGITTHLYPKQSSVEPRWTSGVSST